MEQPAHGEKNGSLLVSLLEAVEDQIVSDNFPPDVNVAIFVSFLFFIFNGFLKCFYGYCFNLYAFYKRHQESPLIAMHRNMFNK